MMIYRLTSVTCLDMRLLFSVDVDSLIWKMKTNATRFKDIQATWRLGEFLPAGLQIEIVISHFL